MLIILKSAIILLEKELRTCYVALKRSDGAGAGSFKITEVVLDTGG
jgi:hypothetical protein